MSKQTKLRLSYPFRAWMIWTLSALFMFYKYALEVSPSVMTTTLMSAFHISGVELGNLAAAYFYAYLIFQIPAGVLVDRFGPRKVTSLAIFICALGSLIFAAAPNLLSAELGRFFIGAGAAFAALNCLKLTANWFPASQFAFMTGLMMTIAMLGAVGGQAPLSQLIHLLDWRIAMHWIGLAGVLFAITFWFVVRDKSPTHKTIKPLTSTRISLFSSILKVWKSPQSWWLSVYSGFAFAPFMVFGGLWGVPFLREAFHLPELIAAQQVALIFIGFGTGAPLFGYLSDRMQNRKFFMFWGPVFALISLSIVIYLPGFSVAYLSLLLFLFGFSISTFLLCFSMIREINPPILAATAIGFMNAFDALFGAFSDPLTGKILDMKWNGLIIEGARIFSVEAYQTSFYTLPIFLFIALLSLTQIKETHCNPTYPAALP